MRVQLRGLLSGTDSLEREAHNLMKSITIRAQFVVEELYSGYNTYNNKSYLPIRKGNAIHDMGLTSVRGRRTEVAYMTRERIYSGISSHQAGIKRLHDCELTNT